MENTYYYGGVIILNEKYFSNLKYEPYQLLINSNNNEQLIKDISSLNGNINYYDLEKEAGAERSTVIVISIFLYGLLRLFL